MVCACLPILGSASYVEFFIANLQITASDGRMYNPTVPADVIALYDIVLAAQQLSFKQGVTMCHLKADQILS